LLLIIVSAEDPEIAAPFLRSISIEDAKSGLYTGGQQSNQLYLVDANGTIDFPVLGKLKVSGLTN
jgi:polysaccharide export outer membrane protein